MASKIEELEERRAARLADLQKKRDEQLVVDLEAREVLEAEHGLVAAVKVSRFVEGHPARAFVKAPDKNEYKRYVDRVGKAVGKENSRAMREAQEELAKACWIYPATEEERDAMNEVHAGILTTIALAAAALAEGKKDEEGKD